jgi:hypothetical protein
MSDSLAVRMPEDDYQRRGKLGHGKLDTVHDHRGGDGTGYAKGEEVADALVEDELGSDARVRAAKYDSEGSRRLEVGRPQVAAAFCLPLDEASVPVPQP